MLYPEETNSTVIMYMCRQLLSGVLTQQRNHLMYIVAIHHVNRYMFTSDGKATDIKKTLLKYAQQCTIEVRVLECTSNISYIMSLSSALKYSHVLENL